MQIIILIGLVVLGYMTGSAIEKKHYKSIEMRESQGSKLPVLTISKLPGTIEVKECNLISGSAVISIDYFKRFLAQLINLVGGKVISYESLVDRARREAILRLKESGNGYDYILNLRVETSVIGNSANRKNGVGSVEVLAYGTAIKVVKDESGL